MTDHARDALRLLREGTEVLRTGGGAKLTASQCGALLDSIDYDTERSAILSTAVGIARVRLGEGEAEEALRVLDGACDATHNLLCESLLARGYTETEVASLVGGTR